MLLLIFLLLVLVLSISLNILLYLIVKKSLDRESRCIKHILECQTEFENCLETMRSFDRLQMFEKDDDVGVVFQKIKEIMEKTDEKIKNQKSI